MPRLGLFMVFALTGWWLLGQPASAQTDASSDASPGAVQLAIRSFGVGGTARVGDWAGVQVEITDLGSVQREVLIEIETTDVDGDRPRFGRTITTNPGAGAERVWVYAFLGQDAADMPVTVSAYEAIARPAEEAERLGVRYAPGGLLGRTTSLSTPVMPAERAAMLVVGRAPAGLSLYERRPQASANWLPGAHEVTTIADGLTTDDLPDRVAGLLPFETIVWTTAEPSRLTSSRADALRRWVSMGGHLVISLPTAPQVWLDASRNPMTAWLPEVEFDRMPLAPSEVLERLGPLLLGSTESAWSGEMVVHGLLPRAAAQPRTAMTILTDTSGVPVVSRRLVGLGMVTVIGFDAADRRLIDAGIPTGRSFWHRVLGRTGTSGEDPARANQAPRISQVATRFFDTDIAALIAKSQAVFLGVVTGFALFALYWILAGPGVFLLLKRAGRTQHAWVASTAIGLVFTGIAWGFVSLVRPSEPEATAVVFVDAVDGVSDVRAKVFASVLEPSYGNAVVELETAREGDVALLTPWTDAQDALLGGAAFPDSRGYALSGRGPSALRFPARATVKTVRGDWLGERRWAMPYPTTPQGGVGSLRVDRRGTVRGTLVHGLPAPLEDGILVVVPPQVPLSQPVGQDDITRTRVYSLAPSYRSWAPGVSIDLGSYTALREGPAGAQDLQNQLQYFRGLLARGESQGLVPPSRSEVSASVNERLLAAAFMSRFPPTRGSASGAREVALRRHTHGLDLGRWFTQPCVMILGVVELSPDIEPPLDWSIEDGGSMRSLPTNGRAVVRWVYPLEPAAPEVGDL
ncbi:MAG: hypothetical protein AAGH71_04175 [Planctomycetota bacterium]